MYNQKITYNLLNQIDGNLDLRYFRDDIAMVVRRYGGKYIRVYKRGYSFILPENTVFTNQMKRNLGREIAAIEGIGKYGITYHYNYKNGKEGISVQLFRIKK